MDSMATGWKDRQWEILRDTYTSRWEQMFACIMSAKRMLTFSPPYNREDGIRPTVGRAPPKAAVKTLLTHSRKINRDIFFLKNQRVPKNKRKSVRDKITHLRRHSLTNVFYNKVISLFFFFDDNATFQIKKNEFVVKIRGNWITSAAV